MHAVQTVRYESQRYQAAALQLRERFGDLDDETLQDTMEGLSDLPDLLKALIRSSLEDEVLMVGLKARLSDMRSRLDRHEERHRRKRELVSLSMSEAGLDKLLAEDFSVSLRSGNPKLEVLDETRLPGAYLVALAPRVDRAGLLAALKRGEPIDGAKLEQGASYIQVRTQ